MPKQRGSESEKETVLKPRNFRPRKGQRSNPKTRVSRKEAAAEIESDGRRNEIADEANSLSCVLKPKRPKPLLNDSLKIELSGFDCKVEAIFYPTDDAI